MNPRLNELKNHIRQGKHKVLRQDKAIRWDSSFETSGLSLMSYISGLTRSMCESEKVIIGMDERIVFTRTLKDAPIELIANATRQQYPGKIFHELGPVSNICADWEMVLSEGLLKRKKTAEDSRIRLGNDPEAVEFLTAAIETIDAVLDLSKRYSDEAGKMGRKDISEILAHVPAHPPRNFHEALQFLRLVHSVVWLSGHYHVGLGRFDQYMWPYLRADLENGRLNKEMAGELLAEFFISLNKDSDLYPGIQQGDNGQTLMIGGVTGDGQSGVNELTYMVLHVAREVAMIDPKINLRVSSDTDPELLSLAAELTRLGLGFPQYSNDNVVIPALTAFGYSPEDARNYTVAACWEFIIPGKGMEVVNIGAVSLPAAADYGIRKALMNKGNFDEIMQYTEEDIHLQTKLLVERYRDLILPPAPFYSVLMKDCLEKGKDLSTGLYYNNFGIHGAAASNAADALAAVKKFVYEKRSVEPEKLLYALDTDYESHTELRDLLSANEHKVGNNDDFTDVLLVQMMEIFAGACESIGDNGRGGRIRPGTGSAMYYSWLAKGHENMTEPVVGATADGRHAGDYFSANLAPSPGVRTKGPISVLQSFGKINYRRICNGGPITIELSDSVFRTQEDIKKVGMLIRTFARLGCQQLQLNTLNADTLKEAKKHPAEYSDLIVRVWGWSGYFCELDEEFQDQIIARHMHSL